MRKIFTLLSLFFLAVLSGCASPLVVAPHPLQISQPPQDQAALPVSIGLVKLSRPLTVGRHFDDRFLSALADALENGMLQACRLVDPTARLLDSEQAGEVDVLLIPTNPFLDLGHATYGIEATLSMEIRVLQKGEEKERGILLEASGRPSSTRPHKQVEILKRRYGLIGAHPSGSSPERAINDALFEFCIQFAQKLEKRVTTYANK